MKTLTFLQWNILYTEDPANVIKLLQELKPDIAALQELTSGYAIHQGQNTPKLIAETLGYHYHAELITSHSGPPGNQFGTGIFSRLPIVSRSTKWINEYNPAIEKGYDNESKPYVEITVKAGAHNLTVGSTHMSYTHRFINYPRKRQEANKLLQILDTKQRDFIFSGDLNSRPSSYTIRRISQHLKHAGPNFANKTWTTKPFEYRGFKEANLNWRLDYVFTTPDLKVICSEIISTPYSDHLPVLAKINIQS